MSFQTLAQIRWYQDRLGLMLVNDQRDRFFLRAEKLVELYNRPDEYLTVKLRDRKPGRAIGYHGGEVVGNMYRDGGQYILTMYLWPLMQNVKFDHDQGVPVGFISTQTYILPSDEMNAYINAITFMLNRKLEFEDLIRAAEATPISTNV